MIVEQIEGQKVKVTVLSSHIQVRSWNSNPSLSGRSMAISIMHAVLGTKKVCGHLAQSTVDSTLELSRHLFSGSLPECYQYGGLLVFCFIV